MRNKSDLRGYQNRSIDRFYESDAVQAVIPMGGGKTVSAATAARELLDAGEIRKAIIFAPKRVCQLVWPSEFKGWDHLADTRILVGMGNAEMRAKALFDPNAEIVIQTIDNIQWVVEQLKGLPDNDPVFDLMIFDEISRFKNPRSKRGKSLRKISRRWKNKWSLTGTPRPNGYEDQFLPLQLISDDKAWEQRSFDAWRRMHFRPIDFNAYKWVVHDHFKPMMDDTIRRWSFTVGDDEMPELPELVFVEHELQINVDQLVHYRSLALQLLTKVKAGTITAAGMAVATGKMEQVLQGFLYTKDVPDADEKYELMSTAKLDWAYDMVTGAGGPVLLAYWYQAELEELRRMFPKLPHIGSGTTDAQAAQYERAWNRGELDVLAIHPASAAHGLNLQHGGHQLVATMPIWSSEYWDQLIKRIHRPGQKHKTFVHVPFMRSGGDRLLDDAKFMRCMGKIDDQEALRQLLEKV